MHTVLWLPQCKWKPRRKGIHSHKSMEDWKCKHYYNKVTSSNWTNIDVLAMPEVLFYKGFISHSYNPVGQQRGLRAIGLMEWWTDNPWEHIKLTMMRLQCNQLWPVSIHHHCEVLPAKKHASFHWNGNVVILMKFSSLAALEVVILTTSSAASEENFIKMMTS